MKARIEKDGLLIVSPEDSTEEWALNAWYRRFTQQVSWQLSEEDRAESVGIGIGIRDPDSSRE